MPGSVRTQCRLSDPDHDCRMGLVPDGLGTPAVRTALEIVACNEPVSASRAERLVGAATLAEMRRAGLVRFDPPGVRLAYPRHGEIIRAHVARRRRQEALRISGGNAMDLLMVGELDEADETAEQGYHDAIATCTPQVAGDWCALRGAIARLRGRITASIAALHEAVTLLEGLPRQQLCSAELAAAYAMSGDCIEAKSWFDRVVGEPQPLVELDRAWVVAAAGDTASGARHALRAAALARASDQRAVETTALYDAARLGAPHVARHRLSRLAKLVSGSTAPVMALAVHAYAERDADTLDRAARAFAELRLPLFAAEAATVATVYYRRAGDAIRATRAMECAAIQLLACPGADTPLLRHDGSVTALTEREREVTVLAASGLTSAAIARRLELSVRTVDNYLGRVYVKLGIVGRQDLKPMFGAVEQLDGVVR